MDFQLAVNICELAIVSSLEGNLFLPGSSTPWITANVYDISVADCYLHTWLTLNGWKQVYDYDI